MASNLSLPSPGKHPTPSSLPDTLTPYGQTPIASNPSRTQISGVEGIAHNQNVLPSPHIQPYGVTPQNSSLPPQSNGATVGINGTPHSSSATPVQTPSMRTPRVLPTPPTVPNTTPALETVGKSNRPPAVPPMTLVHPSPSNNQLQPHPQMQHQHQHQNYNHLQQNAESTTNLHPRIPSPFPNASQTPAASTTASEMRCSSAYAKPAASTPGGESSLRAPDSLLAEIDFNLNCLKGLVEKVENATPASSAKDSCSEAVALAVQIENKIEAFKTLHPSIAAFLPDQSLKKPSTTPSHLPVPTCEKLAKLIDNFLFLRAKIQRNSLTVQLPAPTPYAQYPPHPHQQQSHPHQPQQPQQQRTSLPPQLSKSGQDLGSAVQMSSRKSAMSQELDMSNKVVDSLSRTRSTMSQVLDQSAHAHTTLVSSTETAQAVLNEAESARSALSTSTTLVKKHENKAKMEQRLVFASFLFFMATAGYIVLKRFSPVLRPVGWVASTLYSAGTSVKEIATGSRDPSAIPTSTFDTGMPQKEHHMANVVPAEPTKENPVPRIQTASEGGPASGIQSDWQPKDNPATHQKTNAQPHPAPQYTAEQLLWLQYQQQQQQQQHQLQQQHAQHRMHYNQHQDHRYPPRHHHHHQQHHHQHSHHPEVNSKNEL